MGCPFSHDLVDDGPEEEAPPKKRPFDDLNMLASVATNELMEREEEKEEKEKEDVSNKDPKKRRTGKIKARRTPQQIEAFRIAKEEYVKNGGLLSMIEHYNVAIRDDHNFIEIKVVLHTKVKKPNESGNYYKTINRSVTHYGDFKDLERAKTAGKCFTQIITHFKQDRKNGMSLEDALSIVDKEIFVLKKELIKGGLIDGVEDE
jgi:hypothetical protein